MSEQTVTGRVVSASTTESGRFEVRLVVREMAGAEPVAETTTAPDGTFRLVAPAFDDAVDLQVEVLVDGERVGSSAVAYDVVTAPRDRPDDEPREPLRLDVHLGQARAGAEWPTLRSSIERAGRVRPAELREDAERQDLTYLASKTGWDARVVAMAALADRLADELRTDEIGPGLVYALLRAGVPGDASSLRRLSRDQAERVWTAAVRGGVLAAEDARRLPRALAALDRLAADERLEHVPVPGASSVRELVADVVGDDERLQRAVVDAARRFAGDDKGFWREARQLLGDRADQLRADDLVAPFALGSAPLLRRVRDRVPEARSARELALAGFGEAETWRDLVADLPVPDVVPGAGDDVDDETRHGQLAEVLAAQVRIAHPTAALAHRTAEGRLRLDDGAAGPRTRDVAGFLAEHAEDFAIGSEPLQHYLRRTGAPVDETTVADLERVQRLWQLSPDDTTLDALVAAGVTSAAEVALMPRARFRARYGEALGPSADLVHVRAQQITAATVAVAGSYLTARASGGLTGLVPAVMSAESTGVLAMPTLESLFGSLDWCACDHCRSVLSPAAYLADLLAFLDDPGAPGANPLDVLLARRPDLELLPLTCENTNTRVPYIDLVNEILEHRVAAGPVEGLTSYGGHSHDGTRSSEQLLAEPEYVLDEAYDVLRDATYPPPLPFHRPLETLRGHLAAVGTDLPTVLARLAPTDALDRGAERYAWRDVLGERLGLSRQERTLLVTHDGGLAAEYGFAPGTTADAVRVALTPFVAYARRAGVSHAALVELLTTSFVNPEAVLLPRLEMLRVGFGVLAAFRAGDLDEPGLRALLPAGLDETPYGGDVAAWLRDDAVWARATSLVAATAPPGTDSCAVDELELRRTDPDPTANRVTAHDLHRMSRLLRLRSALGWPLPTVDLALRTLWPAGTWPPQDAAQLDAGTSAVLLRLGWLVPLLPRLRVTPTRDLDALLACWGDLTPGAGSLYARLLGRPDVVALDPAFADDAAGSVLTDPDARLLEHSPALRAAAGLTADELDAVVHALGFDAETPLDLPSVSAVVRRAWLARALRLPVRVLLALVEQTGLDPFTPPAPDGVDPDDAAGARVHRPGLVRLVELLDDLAAAGTTPAVALAAVFGTPVTAGTPAAADPAAPDPGAELARTLRAALATATAELAAGAEPTDETVRAKVALVYGDAVTGRLLALADRSLVLSEPFAADDAALPADVVTAAGGRLAYDDLGKVLHATGPLSDAELAAVLAVADAPLAAAVGALHAAGAAARADLVAAHPELEAPLEAYATATTPVAERRSALLAAVLGEARERRCREQAVLTVAAATGADPILVAALLSDPVALPATLPGGAGGAAVRDLLAVRETATVSGAWSGVITAPADGSYALELVCDVAPGLAVDGVDVPVLAAAGSPGRWRAGARVDLHAGRAHHLRISLPAGDEARTVGLRWSAVGIAPQDVPGAHLLPDAVVHAVGAHRDRVAAAVALARGPGLLPAEVAHLAAAVRVDGAGWLAALPGGGAAVPEDRRPALRHALLELLAYARVRRAAAGADGAGALEVLRATPADRPAVLAPLVGCSASAGTAAADALGLTADDLATTTALARLVDALDVVRTTGLDPAVLAAHVSDDPTAPDVRVVVGSLRARWAEPDWHGVVKPVNDALRRASRDALVARLLHELSAAPATAHLDSPEKLFEHLLVDVQTEPVIETSRIRHALSSVQTFLDRCLLHLEPEIGADAIDAEQAASYRRYRVWEANRKVFLWPENWIEPELRDDQSPIFRETVGELLQQDVTEDAAARTFHAYLTGLQEVAYLRPCGFTVEGHQPGVADDVVHVVARTTGGRQVFHYRRLQGGTWWPWERIGVDIEDVPVLPVVWRGRLFLFWLRLTGGKPTSNGPSATGPLTSATVAEMDPGTPKISTTAVLCYSELANGTWQPTRTSDPSRPVLVHVGANPLHRGSLSLTARHVGSWLDIHPRVSASGGVDTFFFRMFTPHSEPVVGHPAQTVHIPMPVHIPAAPPSPPVVMILPVQSRGLEVEHGRLVATYSSWLAPSTWRERDVLGSPFRQDVLTPVPPVPDPWRAPFFHVDDERVHYVTTTTDDVGGSLVGLLTVDDLTLAPVVDPDFELPYLVAIPEVEPPDLLGPIAGGHVLPADVLAAVTGQARITRGLVQGGTVRFGDVEIGPAGHVGNLERRQR